VARLSNILTKLNDVSNKNYFLLPAYALLALYFVIPNVYFPSLDGPAHIYNSSLLKAYFAGGPVMLENYTLSNLNIPNLFSNYFLMTLMFIFKTSIAVNLFYFIMLFLLLLCSNYLLRSFEAGSPFVGSLVLIIFFNSKLVHFGFYNYMYALSFLMLAIGFFRSKFSRNGKVSYTHYLILFIIEILLFYSNGLAFVLFVFYLSLHGATEFLKRKNDQDRFKKMFTRTIVVLMLSIPFFIMMRFFYARYEAPMDFNSELLQKKWDGLKMASTFIAYHTDREKEISTWIFIAVVLATLLIIVSRIVGGGPKLRKGDVIFAFSFSALLLLFIIPDDYSIGLMNMRFEAFFFLFIMLWVMLQKNSIIKNSFAGLIVAFSFYQYNDFFKNNIKDMNDNISKIVKASRQIEAYSSVVAFNYSTSWIETHFSNYLGYEKPIILLDNYELNYKWFNLRWNTNMPKYLVNGRSSGAGFNWNVMKGKEEKEVDYVFLYQANNRWEEDTALKNMLSSYTRIEVDNDQRPLVALFRHK
jgi:hypothetical protein